MVPFSYILLSHLIAGRKLDNGKRIIASKLQLADNEISLGFHISGRCSVDWLDDGCWELARGWYTCDTRQNECIILFLSLLSCGFYSILLAASWT